MPAGSRLTVRLSPALEARLADRVRQGARVSDIVRDALEAYLGSCPTERPTAEIHASAMVADMADRLSAIASDMTDIQQRLGQIEAQMTTRAASSPRPTRRQTDRQTSGQTARQTPVADTSQQPQPSFDPTRHRLGRLCPRGHNWQETGQSLRANNKAGYCLACQAEEARAKRAARRGRGRRRQAYHEY